MTATNPADRLQDTDQPLVDVLSRMVTDLHDRLRAAETIVVALRTNQSSVVDSLVGQITNQFSALFTSADQLVTAIRNAEFLSATTETPVTFTNGVEATLLLDAGAFPFEPSGVVHLVRTSTTDDYAFGRVLGWDASTRALTVEIFARAGEAGPHSDVRVEIGGVASLIMQSMLDTVEAKRALVQGYADQINVDRAAIHLDMLAIDEDQDAIATDKLLIAGYKNAAEAAAAAAATWDPSNYYAKGYFDGLLPSLTAAQLAASAGMALGVGDGSTGYITWERGTADAPGFLAFYTADDTRRGFIGFHYGDYLLMAAENGWGWRTAKLFVDTELNLGHETDTQLTRSSAGRLAVAGSNVQLASDIATQAQVRSNTAGKLLGVQQAHSSQDWVNLTDATTIAFDMAAGVNRRVTLGGNRTLGQISNARPGQSFCIEVSQPGSTSTRTLSYHSSYVTPASGITIKTGNNVKTLLTGIVLAVSGSTATRVFISSPGDGWT